MEETWIGAMAAVLPGNIELPVRQAYLVGVMKNEP